MSMFERTERGLLARWWWTVDRPMLAGIGLLVLSGMVFVFASSPPVAERLGLPHLHFAGRHALYLLPAAVLLLGSSLLSPVGVRRLAGSRYEVTARIVHDAPNAQVLDFGILAYHFIGIEDPEHRSQVGAWVTG